MNCCSFVAGNTACKVWVLCNRVDDNNEYTVTVVVAVVRNVDSWDYFCYSLACFSVACLGAGGDLVCFCFYRILTKLVHGDVPLLFVVAKIGARCCFLCLMVV